MKQEYDNPGQYAIAWNADAHASGLYILTITNGQHVESKKLTLLK